MRPWELVIAAIGFGNLLIDLLIEQVINSDIGIDAVRTVLLYLLETAPISLGR